MELEIVIWVLVAAAGVIGIHTYLHKLVKFKMDESSILQLLKDSTSNDKYLSTSTISSQTNITAERVVTVCSKSKVIKRNSTEEQSWCLEEPLDH